MTFAGSNAKVSHLFGDYAQSALQSHLLAVSVAFRDLDEFQPRVEVCGLQQVGNGNLCLLLKCMDQLAWDEELHRHQKHFVREYGLTMPGCAESADLSGHITLALAKPKRSGQGRDQCIDWKGSIHDRCSNWEEIPERELETL